MKPTMNPTMNPTTNPATPTLLYVDDDAALARLVDRGLTRRGLKVVHAQSGTEGLARIREG